MRAVRSILCWMLALEAGLCFWAGSMAAGRAAQLSYETQTSAALWELAAALPITGVGILFAAFCVAYWRKRRSTRAWGMVAGGTHVFLAAAFLVLAWVTVRYQPDAARQAPRGGWEVLGWTAGLGVATIAAFWRWNAESGATPRSAKFDGDGTHPLKEKPTPGFSLVGLVAATARWLRWVHHPGQLWSGGASGDYRRVLAMVESSTVMALRPRNFDLAAIERAAAILTDGRRGTHLRLLEYSCNLDCGRLREASQAVNEAEALALASIEEIPVEFYSEFVFAKALVQRDAEGARAWWTRLEAKKPEPSTADIWLARAASLWMDGTMAAAKEAWEKGNALAQALPQAGAYDFERDKYAMLRRELDAERRILRWHDDVALTTL